ncbi:MAG: hypothetical protein RTU92_13600, partial [Candidatus Thorarchaeota archaeon]
IFDDIDYGDLAFIRPYVAYKAARSTPERLPERVIQFFEESEALQVSIEHDHSICPLVVDPEGVDHGACWRIIILQNCPESVKRQFGNPLTGEEVNGLLAPGRLFVGKLYKLKVILPVVTEKDESVVFHEERYIRMYLRSRDYFLKRLIPGTYLRVKDQKWIVLLSETDSGHMIWTAQSTVTDFFFRGNNHVIELSHGRSAREECDRILEVITSDIPAERIVDYDTLEEQVLSRLKNIGYSQKSPSCEIHFSEVSDTSCKITIQPSDGTLKEPLYSLTVELIGGEQVDDIFNAIEENLNNGAMSGYSILRERAFLRKLRRWLEEKLESPGDEGVIEFGEGPEVWSVTLFSQEQVIYWEGERCDRDEYRSGLLYDDHKVFFGESEGRVIEEVLESLNIILIPALKNIENLDEVLNEQIPQIVREIRKSHE